MINNKLPVLPRRSFGRAFTLTEVLVVIAVILILAALSVSAISKMKRVANRTVSGRNLGSLQLANANYAVDHDGRYASVFSFDEDGKGAYWFNNPEFLSYYRGDDLLDASDRAARTVPESLLDPAVVGARKNKYTWLGASYGYNITGMPGGNFGQKGTDRTFRTFQVTSPDQTAAFFTATDHFVHHSGRFRWAGEEGKTSNQAIAYRHNGKALVVYFDGHVAEVSVEDVKNYDKRGGGKSLFWSADGAF